LPIARPRIKGRNPMNQENIEKFLRGGVEELEISTAGLSIEEARRRCQLTEIVKLASNENPLGPSPQAKKVAMEMAGKMNVYPEPAAAALRSVIAQTHGVAADQVLHGNGSSEVITFIGHAFINQGDECVIPTPTYHRYQEISQLMGAKNILVPLKEYRIDWEEMGRRASAKTKLFVIVSPNNPTGDIVRRREMEAFLQQVGKNRIVVLDEAYAEYTDDPEFAPGVEFIAQGYPVIVLRTFSKIYALAGARLGYAISRPELIKYMDQVRPTFNTNRFAQFAGMEAMKDQEHFQKCRKMVLDEKKYYYEEFKKMGLYHLPTSANFIFVGVGVDDQEMHAALVKLGIILRPLTPWGYKGFMRITIGTHEQNEKVVAGMKKALGEMKKR
jgi:histidinol-phosphate aminotransferase